MTGRVRERDIAISGRRTPLPTIPDAHEVLLMWQEGVGIERAPIRATLRDRDAAMA